MTRPPRLDDLIASARADEPSAAALDRLEHKLAGLLGAAGAAGAAGAGAGGTSAGATASKAVMAAWAKWLLGGAVLAVITGGIIAVRQPVSVATTDAGTAVSDAMPDAPMPVDAIPVDAALTTNDPPPAAKPAGDARPPAKRSAKPSGAATDLAQAEALAAEASLLSPAQTALRDGDAARALALTARHTTRFPHGALVEERERIAIEALLRLGRRDAATARARDFDRRFPHSIQSSRLHDLLAR